MNFFQKNKKKDFHRSVRVSQELKKTISDIFQKNIKDPRINFVITISMVHVSRDLSYAKVFFSYLNHNDNLKKKFHNFCSIEEILKILEKSSNYIRKILHKKLNLRITPILHFCYDDSLLKGMKISKLIKGALNNHK